MSAPKGNQFWKQRSSHGREMLFASPSLLWEAACEYFQFCDDNPWIKTDYKGSEIVQVEIPTARPYSLSGLCIFLDCSTSYFRTFKSIADEEKKDFLTVIEKIEEVIKTQQFEGATVGAFNANIIARTLGLTDNSKVENTNINYNVSPTKEEAKEISEALENKF